MSRAKLLTRSNQTNKSFEFILCQQSKQNLLTRSGPHRQKAQKSYCVNNPTIKAMLRAEEANLGGSVLPRQQSALLCEAVAAEPQGF